MNSHRHNIKLVNILYIWGLFISLFSFVGLLISYVNKNEGTQLEEKKYRKIIKSFWFLQLPYFIFSRFLLFPLLIIKVSKIDISLYHINELQFDILIWSSLSLSVLFLLLSLFNSLVIIHRLPPKSMQTLTNDDVSKFDKV